MYLLNVFNPLKLFLLTFILIACSATCQARASGSPLVLYSFNEGSGTIVHDVSGNGTPMDLAIQNPAYTHWLSGGGLSIDQATVIANSGLASKIINAVKASNALTIEAWVKPANTTQDGPARIVTLSAGPFKRNFTLAQNSSAYDVRLRSTKTNNNGKPPLVTPAGLLSTALTHVVYTRNNDGVARLYVNGVKQSHRTVGGNLGNWNDNYSFALTNEPSGNRPWLGKLYQIAVYDKALTATDIDSAFAAGPDTTPSQAASTGYGSVATSTATAADPTPSSVNTVPTATGSVSLDWATPATRTNGTPIAIGEIAGYIIHYAGYIDGVLDVKSLYINNASTTSVTIKNLPLGTYYFAMQTIDSRGQYSPYSNVLTKPAL